LRTFPKKRSNDVFLNGNKISLGDSLFALLMRLVVELKKKKGGWVNTADLKAEGYINDIMLHQLLRLRSLRLRSGLRSLRRLSVFDPSVNSGTLSGQALQ